VARLLELIGSQVAQQNSAKPEANESRK
jgi:hypothetical protein